MAGNNFRKSQKPSSTENLIFSDANGGGMKIWKIMTLIFIIVSINTASAIEIPIEKTEVIFNPDNVTVVFHYKLDPVQAIKAFLFGAEDIEREITGLLERSDYVIKKVDFNTAEICFNVSTSNERIYFPGVKLREPVPDMILIFPGNSSIELTNSTEIPQTYFYIN